MYEYHKDSPLKPTLIYSSSLVISRPEAHKNRHLQINAPPMSYLCQLLTMNGFGTVKARCINLQRLPLSWLLLPIDLPFTGSTIRFWRPPDHTCSHEYWCQMKGRICNPNSHPGTCSHSWYQIFLPYETEYRSNGVIPVQPLTAHTGFQSWADCNLILPVGADSDNNVENMPHTALFWTLVYVFFLG